MFIFNHEIRRFMAVSPVLCTPTNSLSDDRVLSIFFLGGLCSCFHVIDTVLLILVSDCFPFCLHVNANVNIYLNFE